MKTRFPSRDQIYFLRIRYTLNSQLKSHHNDLLQKLLRSSWKIIILCLLLQLCRKLRGIKTHENKSQTNKYTIKW